MRGKQYEATAQVWALDDGDRFFGCDCGSVGITSTVARPREGAQPLCVKPAGDGTHCRLTAAPFTGVVVVVWLVLDGDGVGVS